MVNKETIRKLQQEILLMQGFKATASNAVDNGGLSLISEAFPNQSFPVGAVHEFVSSSPETNAASSGFVSAISSFFMKNGEVGAWIGSGNSIFPPALKYFGIAPEHLFFIEPKNEKEKIWTIEEALKCDAFTVVIADINSLGFMESRKFQLAVEQSGVTCFLLGQSKKTTLSNCAVARWQIRPMSSISTNELPGVGFTQWNVSLLKIRNGKPANWQLQWEAGKFEYVQSSQAIEELALRKVV